MAGMSETLREMRDRLVAELLARRDGGGPWRGRLSNSALATAVATVALRRQGDRAAQPCVGRGVDWLARHANADGGWGDTPASVSNLSTTLLALGALTDAAPTKAEHQAASQAGRAWLGRQIGGCQPERIARAVDARYGQDRTFSAPILSFLALTGWLGSEREAWRHVAALPYELALLPEVLMRSLKLPVVSYALPALIAIGQLRHRLAPAGGGLLRAWRRAVFPAAERKLRTLQPPDGGFLAAAPLTGFVTLALAATGRGEHPVARRGAAFLAGGARDDGAWPIDSDLATWVTTQAIDALAAGGRLDENLPVEDQRSLVDWLGAQQQLKRHPYTQAEPGGWAWTDLPGGVPDADDTSGAMLALLQLAGGGKSARRPLRVGLAWLCGLQNADGGMPTFCRGWGTLPFDRSSPDLTAHALRAVSGISGRGFGLGGPGRALQSGLLGYLSRAQRADGSWVPLWFGNEAEPASQNPTYGTARVVHALAEANAMGRSASRALAAGVRWLLWARQADGGWGGGGASAPSLEETSLAVRALGSYAAARPAEAQAAELRQAIQRGCRWLAEATHAGRRLEASPIGLYFAELWYAEREYPLVFALAAVESALALGAVQ